MWYYRKLIVATVVTAALAVVLNAVPGIPGNAEAWAGSSEEECAKYKPDRTLSDEGTSHTGGSLGIAGWSGSAEHSKSDKRTQQALSNSEIEKQLKVYRACVLFEEGLMTPTEWQTIAKESVGVAVKEHSTQADSYTPPYLGLRLDKVLKELPFDSSDKKMQKKYDKAFKACQKENWEGCYTVGDMQADGSRLQHALDLAALICMNEVSRGLQLSSESTPDDSMCWEGALIMDQLNRTGLGDQTTPAKILWFWKNTCKLNEPKSCAIVGLSLRKGRGAPVDLEAGKQADRQGCRLKAWPSCERLLRDQLTGSTPPGADAVDTLTQNTCEFAGPEVCLKRGEEFLDVELPLTDDIGERLLKDNCTRANNGQSCAALGDEFWSRKPGDPSSDEKKYAAEFYLKACELGVVAACGSFGVMALNGKGMSQNKELAWDYLNRACNGGFENVCNLIPPEEAQVDATATVAPAAKGIDPLLLPSLDYPAYLSVSRPQPTSDAVRLAKKNMKREWKDCAKGVLAQCYKLGSRYQEGSGVEQSHIRASELKTIACDYGYARSCTDMGYRYEKGIGVEQSNTQAVKMFSLACDGDNSEGCNSLGFLYEYGPGVSKDDKEAFRLYKKACSLDDQHGCFNLGRHYEHGFGVSVDKSQAKVLYQKACLLGHKDSCAWQP